MVVIVIMFNRKTKKRGRTTKFEMGCEVNANHEPRESSIAPKKCGCPFKSKSCEFHNHELPYHHKLHNISV